MSKPPSSMTQSDNKVRKNNALLSAPFVVWSYDASSKLVKRRRSSLVNERATNSSSLKTRARDPSHPVCGQNRRFTAKLHVGNGLGGLIFCSTSLFRICTRELSHGNLDLVASGNPEATVALMVVIVSGTPSWRRSSLALVSIKNKDTSISAATVAICTSRSRALCAATSLGCQSSRNSQSTALDAIASGRSPQVEHPCCDTDRRPITVSAPLVTQKISPRYSHNTTSACVDREIMIRFEHLSGRWRPLPVTDSGTDKREYSYGAWFAGGDEGPWPPLPFNVSRRGAEE